jgi:hypothetical protein
MIISVLIVINFSCTSRKESEVACYTVSAEKIPKDSLKHHIKFPGYQLKASYYDMVLSGDGQLNVTERGGESFNMTIFHDTSLSIKAVEYGMYKKDLIVICELSKGREEWSEVVRVSLNKRKVKWKIHFGSFNLSTAIIHDKYLYGATLGYVGKVNLKKGKIVWQKDDLWEKYKVNNFEKIVLYNDTLALIGRVYKMNNKTMTGEAVTFKYNRHDGREIARQ